MAGGEQARPWHFAHWRARGTDTPTARCEKARRRLCRLRCANNTPPISALHRPPPVCRPSSVVSPCDQRPPLPFLPGACSCSRQSEHLIVDRRPPTFPRRHFYLLRTRSSPHSPPPSTSSQLLHHHLPSQPLERRPGPAHHGRQRSAARLRPGAGGAQHHGFGCRSCAERAGASVFGALPEVGTCPRPRSMSMSTLCCKPFKQIAPAAEPCSPSPYTYHDANCPARTRPGPRRWPCSRPTMSTLPPSCLPPPRSRARCVALRPSRPSRPSLLTHADCLRPAPVAPRVAVQAARYHHQPPSYIPRRAQTHQTPALRVPRKSGYSDDRVEGCAASDTFRAWFGPLNAALRSRLPTRPSRGSYTRSQNRAHSTFDRPNTIHQPIDALVRGRAIASSSYSHDLICRLARKPSCR